MKSLNLQRDKEEFDEIYLNSLSDDSWTQSSVTFLEIQFMLKFMLIQSPVGYGEGKASNLRELSSVLKRLSLKQCAAFVMDRSTIVGSRLNEFFNRNPSTIRFSFETESLGLLYSKILLSTTLS